MFLWFGEGRYVLKALELKALHEPLSEEQQSKYEQMRKSGGFIATDYGADQETFREEALMEGVETEDEEDNEFSLQENMLKEDTQEIPSKEMDIEVKTVDVSQYNTINLQKELAESMREFLEDHKTQQLPVEETNEALKTKVFEPVSGLDSPEREFRQDTDEMQPVTEKDLGGEPEEMPVPGTQENSSEEVFFGNTEEVNIQQVVSELVGKNGINTPFAPIKTEELQEQYIGEKQPEPVEKAAFTVPAASPNPSVSNTGVIRTFHKPSGYDNILSQEYDGQISLVMPEQQKIEKQITGQLSIDDVMAEWERIKQENERKRMEEIRKRVHQQTDALFADFDESTKSGLLEKLENAMVTAAMKEEREKIQKERPKVVKVSDMEVKEPEKTVIPEPEEEIEAVPEEEVLEGFEELRDTGEGDIEEIGEDSQEQEAGENREEIADEVSEDGSGTEEESALEEESDTEEESVQENPEKKEEHAKAVREMSGSEREQFAPFIYQHGILHGQRDHYR